MMEIIEGRDKFKVRVVAIKSGEDLTVIISGGEKPHIGAMAVSIPRPWRVIVSSMIWYYHKNEMEFRGISQIY